MRRFRIIVLLTGIGSTILSEVWPSTNSEPFSIAYLGEVLLALPIFLIFSFTTLLVTTIPFLLFFFWSRSKSKAQIITAGVLLLLVAIPLNTWILFSEHSTAVLGFIWVTPLSIILVPLGFFIGYLYDNRFVSKN
ncbi:MAG: hypothetical protein HYW38_00045 [Candidatus Colwellbacteria bacterium]|nr:hypothetical protein [Candidatus Colwellbacteria bacterium]